MLFHVYIDVHIPYGTEQEKLKELSAREHERAKELQLGGKWTHLWRVAGQFANVSIFDVADPGELARDSQLAFLSIHLWRSK